jgi:drug/metabolite transporter (DMT)-like permease
VGPLFVLLSAAGFGLMAIFAKLAYAEGTEVSDLLVVRFGLAGAALVAVSVWTGALRRLDRRTVLAALGMGVFGYAAQAGLYLAAVARVDASEVALVFCVYPVLVMVAAVAIGRERFSGRRLAALALAVAGSALVLGGVSSSGGFDVVSSALALGSALVYTCYILVGDRVVRDAPAVPLTALVCVGAFTSCLTGSLLTGGPDLDMTAAGWGWIGVIALVCTVASILLFFSVLARVGPSMAALLSGIEPVVTVGAAAAVFGEVLTTAQALGGVLVVAAVVLVQWRSGAPRLVAAPVPERV